MSERGWQDETNETTSKGVHEELLGQTSNAADEGGGAEQAEPDRGATTAVA